MNVDTWAGIPTLADRVQDTQREIDADPTDITVTTPQGAVVGTFHVRIIPVSRRAARFPQSEGASAAEADVMILALPGTDLKRGYRARTTRPGEFYRITFVSPGQDWRVEAAAVVEE